jgi:peptidoglycan/xylan/chitin deacetylase (PgdA/CDA1 family)/CelD/BcsL family acetyltransferase involved in cellulose biosynthesis
MIVEELRDRGEWERLKAVWNPLLAESASATTFLTWEWLTAWWSAYGNTQDLRILTVSDDSGTIRGIAPLRVETVRRYGQAFSTLAFVGDGSSDSDYLDFIVARGFEERAVEAWLEHLRDDLARSVILRLNEIPSDSPNLRALRGLSDRYMWEEQGIPCATIHLPTDWNDYFGMLRPRFRTKIRSVLRNLEARAEVRFGFCERQSELERLLPALFDLHTRRWNHDGRPGVFGWDRKRRFYDELSSLLLERGLLRLSWLQWNDRILACQYGFTHGQTYLHLQEGYEPASEHWNVGVALRAWSIRELLRAGVREYDFLAGVGRHKTDWGAEVKESRRIVLAAPTYRNRLFCRGPEWQEQAKQAAKRVLPAAVLAARKARIERSLTGPGGPTTQSERIRRAVAKCYFHLGGPAAARLLCARYQMSMSPNGRLVRGSWTRRREPAGRILYYHRVNGDNDPFFPSLRPEVFERHMRHIARNYKVVSLTGLLDHLANGSPANVVAITFDDGYRDNYEIAFPVLQRYRLPATIFLTTGSLDSGEPLWFEVLAGALKNTSREFLDLEIELPRRFWLRSVEERLRANGQLFTLLRSLPDDERQRRLSMILKELASHGEALHTRTMLTWDHVRHMKTRGIDFGGHTVTHPYLSRLTRDRVAWEISECKRRIEEEVQAPVTHFAYPNGREEDFASWNKDVLRNAGYQAAVTTLWGMNFPTTDRLELRRGGAWEEHEALFAYKMDWYQLVNG